MTSDGGHRKLWSKLVLKRLRRPLWKRLLSVVVPSWRFDYMAREATIRADHELLSILLTGGDRYR